jgi:predicted alpha-1,2-mannosidase
VFIRRAQNYRHIYDRDSGFMRPRNLDGSWLAPFDPMSPKGWVEANGWHYLFWVPHDVEGLIRLMGGRRIFVQRLNDLFEKAETQGFTAPGNHHHEAYVQYGNQPASHMAHLFTYAGAPWLTQKWVRRVMNAAKSDTTPDGGYAGDEDQGQMGSLNALMAMGIFQMRGGADADPVYEITSPVFSRVTICGLHPTGQDFIIEAANASEDNIYIQ